MKLYQNSSALYKGADPHTICNHVIHNSCCVCIIMYTHFISVEYNFVSKMEHIIVYKLDLCKI